MLPDDLLRDWESSATKHLPLGGVGGPPLVRQRDRAPVAVHPDGLVDAVELRRRGIGPCRAGQPRSGDGPVRPPDEQRPVAVRDGYLAPVVGREVRDDRFGVVAAGAAWHSSTPPSASTTAATAIRVRVRIVRTWRCPR